MIQCTPVAIVSDVVVGSRQVEGTPIIMSLAEKRPSKAKHNATDWTDTKALYFSPSFCMCRNSANHQATPAFHHVYTSDQAAKWAVPSEWINFILYGNPRKHMLETLRVFYEHSGIALCGSQMPCIELRRDPAIFNAGHGCYNFMFVIPSPAEAAEVDFSHPNLIKWRG